MGIFKKKGPRRWLISSIALLVVFGLLTVLTNTIFMDILETVLGGRVPVYADGVESVYVSDLGLDTKAGVLDAANKLVEEVCEEGFVLLKNLDNALPLSSGAKISVFGKNSINLAYGGSGSGGGDSNAAKTIYDSLEAAGFETNPVLKSFYEDNKASGGARSSNSSDLDSGDTVVLSTAETPQASYTDNVKSSYNQYSDAAIIVFTRIGGEGFDLPRSMKGAAGAYDENDHFLRLDKNERDLVDAVTAAGFGKVIVLINAGTSMELGLLEDNSDVDAVLNIGFPGTTGIMALGRILKGEVNPSGRTVDTYSRDFTKDPTWVNFGDNLITGDTNKKIQGGDQYDLDGTLQLYYFVDYEEGEYVGYRYYETRGFTDGESWYNENVVYPFGYGLSYTSFEWTIEDVSELQDVAIDMNGKYTVKIRVGNTGSVPGKDVVELYATPPYFDGEIEKSHKVLVDFAKTPELAPGESTVVELTFDPYYIASYDYLDANNNGFAGYELDAGDYALHVSKNAHESVLEIDFTVDENIQYETDPVTGYWVENRYTEQDDEFFNSNLQLSTVLSRADWEGTWPNTPTDEERSASKAFINALKDVETNNPNDYSDYEMPETGAAVTISFRDMLTDENGGYGFVAYDDPRWETLLDQLSYEELSNLFEYGGFKTEAIQKIGKPLTNDTDGPAGFVNFMDNSGTFWGTCYYCSETVMAATWNVDLLSDVGNMIGNEGILGAADKGNGMPYSGWYAPAVNIHRSPFGGRNFEYYSEDGVLNGKMAAAVIEAARGKGVYCYLKHFALNEQETHRSIGGDLSWVTEQAMREIFLRPFEIAVKEGGTRAIMSSFNRIGTRWTGGDYRLLTEILRNEWGFQGMVISDFNTCPHMDTRLMAYAGGDLNLVKVSQGAWSDESDTGDMVILRQAAKNVLYTVVNSNAMNGEIVAYNPPIWSTLLFAFDGVLVVALAVWGFFVIRKAKKET